MDETAPNSPLGPEGENMSAVMIWQNQLSSTS